MLKARCDGCGAEQEPIIILVQMTVVPLTVVPPTRVIPSLHLCLPCLDALTCEWLPSRLPSRERDRP